MHGDPSHCPRYCRRLVPTRPYIVVTKDCLSFPILKVIFRHMPACIEEYQLWGNLEKPPQHGFTLYPYPALSLILRLVLVSHVTRPAIQPENSNI